MDPLTILGIAQGVLGLGQGIAGLFHKNPDYSKYFTEARSRIANEYIQARNDLEQRAYRSKIADTANASNIVGRTQGMTGGRVPASIAALMYSKTNNLTEQARQALEARRLQAEKEISTLEAQTKKLQDEDSVGTAERISYFLKNLGQGMPGFLTLFKSIKKPPPLPARVSTARWYKGTLDQLKKIREAMAEQVKDKEFPKIPPPERFTIPDVTTKILPPGLFSY